MTGAEVEPQRSTEQDLSLIAAKLKPLGSAQRLRLLRFLTTPHYLEEIATFLKMNRYAAKRHVDELEEAGLIRAVPGRRDSGPVRDYIVAPEGFFEVYDAVRTLGELRPAPETFAQTLPGMLERTRPSSKREERRKPASPFPYLVVVYGAEIGRAYALAPKRGGPAQWLVGRDTKAEIVLDDPFVSNRHARISRDGDKIAVTDAFSTNGTHINWTPLPSGETAPLSPGDVLGIGKTLLVFQRESV